MSVLTELTVPQLVEQLSILRDYHAAVPEHVYDDETGPLARPISDIKRELTARLGSDPR